MLFKLQWGFFALFIGLCALFSEVEAAPVTVDRIVFQDDRPTNFGPTFLLDLLLVPVPFEFELNDGSVVRSGAGTVFTLRGDLIGTSGIGSGEITYSFAGEQFFDRPPGVFPSLLFDYGFSNFSTSLSTSATFELASPLNLVASEGGTTAQLQAQLRVLTNNFTDPNFPPGTPLSSSVGDLVSLHLVLTLIDEVFDDGTFSRLGAPSIFNRGYRISGYLDLTQSEIPVPAAFVLFASVLPLIVRRRRKGLCS